MDDKSILKNLLVFTYSHSYRQVLSYMHNGGRKQENVEDLSTSPCLTHES